MFKKYRIGWHEEDGAHSVDFFVNSKRKRNGFIHRACMLGMPPRLDSADVDWSKYSANTDRLFNSRTARMSYVNRTWESYDGQTCLAHLWEKLSKLKFVDMGRISAVNPFESRVEPEYEDLLEPDELFDRLKRTPL